jgi:hypothetical protein
MFFWVYISIAAVTAAYGFALTATHFCRRPKVSKTLRPSVRPLAKARCSLAPVLLRGPAAIGHPWPGAASPASMPGCPLRRTSIRPSEGAGRSKSKAEGELTLGLMSGEKRNQTRFPVGAGLPAKSVWTTRSFRRPALSLTSIASKLAPQLIGVRRGPCRSEPARDGGLKNTAPSKIFRRQAGSCRGCAMSVKKSTYIQFSPPPHRHYRMRSRRFDADGFSFVQVVHERFAMG